MLGKENLTAKRPAVFIFNHRNQADPLIAGRLVSDNFTSVGKKELEKDPIVGTMGKIMDAAFIDRDDPAKAVEGLKKVEELARKGLSILIAPEGTRLDTTEVGDVQEGAVPHRDVGGNPDRAHRDPQRRGDRCPRFEHVQCRHRRCRGVPADSGRRLDARQPCPSASPRCASSTSTR